MTVSSVAERVVLTVLLGALLHGERSHLHLLRLTQGSPGGHQADGGRAQEAVGPTQSGRTQPAGPRQSSAHRHGPGQPLWSDKKKVMSEDQEVRGHSCLHRCLVTHLETMDIKHQ